jgi:hypothetical protein
MENVLIDSSPEPTDGHRAGASEGVSTSEDVLLQVLIVATFRTLDMHTA